MDIYSSDKPLYKLLYRDKKKLMKIELVITHNRHNTGPFFLFSFVYIPCILILSKFFYSSTDAQVSCLRNNFKIYIKIDIKTALLYSLTLANSNNALPDDGDCT
jgi:hypothetical protein